VAEEAIMTTTPLASGIGRRAILKSALALGAARMASPYILSARAADPIRIGIVAPLTGTYAALGKNEQIGAQYAVERLNAKGGLLGRPIELLVEDSTSGDVGVAVQKTAKLIERDQVSFVLGNVNSAMTLAMGQKTSELKTLQIVTGGHTDAVTGTDCHWNVFRVCNTTQMEANSVASVLINKYGKKWYYITPDYAFGHTLQAGMEKAAAKLGGIKLGGDLTPLGTTDFSSYLIKAQSSEPDVLIVLTAGDDSVNLLKQAVQFGLNDQLHIAGAQQELEVLIGLPPEARIGTWVFEWYWNQPGVAHVAEFVDGVKQKTGKTPTARTWFGYAAATTCALVAEQEKSLDPIKLARALQGFKLPPEVALMPGAPFYRAEDHQLIPSLFVGDAQGQGSTEDDLFKVSQVVAGPDVAAPPEETGCKLTWPV
jgi:branched-chain amino acid transport system substrate-binding protein